MEACHCLLAADALRIEVAMPLLESRGCCQRAHVRISVRSGQGLTFYRRRSALRGNKRRRVLRHLAVFLRDPTLRMCRPADGHAAVPDVDVGMVVRALREVAEPHHEIDRLAEGRELELPHERVVLLLPVGHRGSIPLAGRANPARSYKTPEECVNRVTETSYGGRGAATETLRPPSSAATGATLGARRSPSPGGARSQTTWRRTASSVRSPRWGGSTSAGRSGRGCTGSSPTGRSTISVPSAGSPTRSCPTCPISHRSRPLGIAACSRRWPSSPSSGASWSCCVMESA